MTSLPIKLCVALASGAALAALSMGLASPVWAQAADVNCNGCVNTKDIANNAVTRGKIKNRAVNAIKLSHGIVPIVTEVQSSGSNTDSSITFSYELLRDHGTFQKRLGARTDVKLTLTGHGTVVGRFCDFQLRIDGADEEGGTSTGSGAAGRAVIGEVGGSATSNLGDAFGVTALFEGLSAGAHDLEIWVRGEAASCTFNTGNFPINILVEEFEAAAPPASAVLTNDQEDLDLWDLYEQGELR